MNVSSVMSNTTNLAQTHRKAEPPPQPEAKPISAGDDETFIDKAYHRILLNRMGVDTKQLEAIEKKIEELEGKSNLTKDEKEKLESLKEARDQLFEDAIRRHAENGAGENQSVSGNSIQGNISNQYDTPAISPCHMNNLIKDLYDTDLTAKEQRSGMSFQFAKTDLYKTYPSGLQPIDPDDPQSFV